MLGSTCYHLSWIATYFVYLWLIQSVYHVTVSYCTNIVSLTRIFRFRKDICDYKAHTFICSFYSLFSPQVNVRSLAHTVTVPLQTVLTCARTCRPTQMWRNISAAPVLAPSAACPCCRNTAQPAALPPRPEHAILFLILDTVPCEIIMTVRFSSQHPHIDAICDRRRMTWNFSRFLKHNTVDTFPNATDFFPNQITSDEGVMNV